MGVFGSAPTLNTGAGDTYRQTLAKIGTNYGDTYNQQNAQYQGDQAGANRANNAWSQYLQQDPATQTYNAQQIAGAEQGLAQAGAAGKANLSADLLRRGISPNSSAGIGGLASIDQGMASTDANVRAGVAQHNQDLYRANLGENANFQNGLANTDYGRASNAANSWAGINTSLLSEADQQAIEQLQAKEQQNANQAALWGSLANAGATAFAASKKPG